jgi:endogenous inhibitor of DNA gyrase (YacG/DUF329 family)
MTTDQPQGKHPQQPPRCLICGRPRDPRYRPFCSARCRDRDLLNWLDGRYVIPVQESEPDEDGPGP